MSEHGFVQVSTDACGAQTVLNLLAETAGSCELKDVGSGLQSSVRASTHMLGHLCSLQ